MYAVYSVRSYCCERSSGDDFAQFSKSFVEGDTVSVARVAHARKWAANLRRESGGPAIRDSDRPGSSCIMERHCCTDQHHCQHPNMDLRFLSMRQSAEVPHVHRKDTVSHRSERRCLTSGLEVACYLFICTLSTRKIGAAR